MSKKYKFEPNYAVHPGETLREKLEEINMPPKEFAIRTGKPVKTISNVLNGKSSITPEMAIQFEKVLGISANFWMKKQANYDEFVARKKEEERVNQAVKWARKFPYSQLSKMGYVKCTRKPKERAKELLSFFNISKPEAWEKIYLKSEIPIFFRISLKHAKDPYALSALLKIGEIEANKINAKPYNRKKLKEILLKLKEIMYLEPDDFLYRIQEYCLTAGVKVVYTKQLQKTAINGVVRWINDNPVIQMTDRLKRYDVFWFSFFHEIGHILLHGKKKNIFLEWDKLKERNIQEKEADDFAAKTLLTENEYREILSSLNKKAENKKDFLIIIESFSKKNRTHRDIIIGRILHENKGLYKHGFLQKQIKKVDFEEKLKIKELTIRNDRRII